MKSIYRDVIILTIMKEYFLTVRKHQVKDYVSEYDLKEILNTLERRLPLIVDDVVFEIDSKYEQLHSHILLRTPKSVYYKKHSSINGFRVYWRLVVDHKPTYDYMHKDSCNKYEQEQIIISNYYRHHYGFVD